MVTALLKRTVIRYLRNAGYTLTTPTASYVTEHFAAEFLYFTRALSLVRGKAGDIVECGVWRGHSFLEWALLMNEDTVRRHLWGFDSFKGYPAVRQEDGPAKARSVSQGAFTGTSIEHVVRRLRDAGLTLEFVRNRTTLIPGFFKDTLSLFRGEIAVLHLDGNLYESTRECLNVLWPHVISGGVVLFNEYARTDDHEQNPGSRLAVDEFFAQRPERLERDPGIGKYYVVKSDAPSPGAVRREAAGQPQAAG